VEAKQRFIDLIRERFNAGVTYKGRVLKWDTVIEQKANELGRYLTGKSSMPDFVEPAPKLERQDGRELRTKILALTVSQAGRLGVGKSTLHYLRKKTRNNGSFRVYGKVRAKIECVRGM
jgi:hypothetical protein